MYLVLFYFSGIMELQGHRGFGNLAPHNSLRAFELAGVLGLDSVEFDVRRLHDGTLVVTHGPELDRGTGTIETLDLDSASKIPLPEAPMNYKESRGILAKVKSKSSQKSLTSLDLADALEDWVLSKTNNQSGSGSTDGLHELLRTTQTIPTLETVVQTCIKHGLIMNIELKESKFIDDVAAKAFDIVKKYDPDVKHSRISSFDKSILWSIQDRYPEIPVGALFNAGHHRNEAIGIMVREPTPANFLDHLRPGQDSINLCAETTNEEEVRKALEKEITAMAWFPGVPDGPEDEQKFHQLKEMGFKIICTNRPDLALAMKSQ